MLLLLIPLLCLASADCCETAEEPEVTDLRPFDKGSTSGNVEVPVVEDVTFDAEVLGDDFEDAAIGFDVSAALLVTQGSVIFSCTVVVWTAGW